MFILFSGMLEKKSPNESENENENLRDRPADLWHFFPPSRQAPPVSLHCFMSVMPANKKREYNK